MTQQDVEILYQDAEVVVASKPSGLLVHRSRESADREFLLQRLRDQLGRHLFPVHRLDRAASGAIAFALSSESAAALQRCLSAPDTVKEYIALARGNTPEARTLDRPLSDENGNPRPALTRYEKLGAFRTAEGDCSLLRVRIGTGRRHQIRRHLSHEAHQLLGDTVYGKGRINRAFRERYGLCRLFLHAYRLDMPHPSGERRIQVKAPLPRELCEVLARLPLRDSGISEEMLADLCSSDSSRS